MSEAPSETRIEYPPIDRWDPQVVRWVENYALFQDSPRGFLLSVFLDEDNDWRAACVRTIGPEFVEQLEAIIFDDIKLVGDRRIVEHDVVGAPLVPEALERLQQWRNERREAGLDLAEVVRDSPLAEVFASCRVLTGGVLHPWPFLCLALAQFETEDDWSRRLWTAPIVLRVGRSEVRVQIEAGYDVARRVAGDRPLIAVALDYESPSLYQLPFDPAGGEAHSGHGVEWSLIEFPPEKLTAVSVLAARNRSAGLPGLLRELVQRTPGQPLVWFMLPPGWEALNFEDLGTEDTKQTADETDPFTEASIWFENFALRLDELGGDLLLTTPPGMGSPDLSNLLPGIVDRLESQGSRPSARPALSDSPEGEDQLDRERVARAMALVTCMEGSTLPLCVGVFGDWGSGKSFLMELMCKEIADGFPSAPPGLADKLHRNVAIVRFNAWTYAKADLWSALLYRLLQTLQAWRTPQSAREEQMLVELKRSLEEQEQRIREIDREAAIVRSRIVARREADPGQLILLAAEERLEELRHDVEQKARAWRQWPRTLWKWITDTLGGELPSPAKTWIWIALLAVLFLVVQHFLPADLLVALWDADGRLNPGGAATGLAAVAALIPSVRSAVAVVKPLKQQFDRAQGEFQKAQEMVEAKVEELRRALTEDLTLEAESIEVRRKNARKAAESIRDEITQLSESKKPELPAETLMEFLTQRLEEGDYESRLGLLHQVERDLYDLSLYFARARERTSSATEPTRAPRIDAPDRVVLCIDDLDRCPPDKVVAVLEAVQLLLADNEHLPKGTENHPFVVVLGADTRILTRALEKQYDRILTSSDRPSGLDYIEKIIQLPYWLPPIDEPGFRSYVSHLTGVEFTPERVPATPPLSKAARATLALDSTAESDADSEPVGDLVPIQRDVHAVGLVTREDLACFARFRPVAPGSPRALKRLVNQFRLCKAIAIQSRVPFRLDETVFLLFMADGFRASTRILARRLDLALPADHALPEFFSSLLSHLEGQLRSEIHLLLEALGEIGDGLPTLAQLKSVRKEVLPYCFIGDVAQRAGQDVSNVQLEAAQAAWSTGDGTDES